MSHQIITLLSFLLLTVSCTTTSNEPKETGSTPRQDSLNSSSPIDTNKIIKIVAEDILQRLKGQHIKKSDFDENGDYYIEFNDEAVGTTSDNEFWNYYSIEKNHLITGQLNNDQQVDFAIRSTSGPTVGSLFGLEWHIYVSDENNYRSIENDFGGGKFSDMEAVKSIKNMVLQTHFQALNQETSRLKDSIELRTYRLIGDKLESIE